MTSREQVVLEESRPDAAVGGASAINQSIRFSTPFQRVSELASRPTFDQIV